MALILVFCCFVVVFVWITFRLVVNLIRHRDKYIYVIPCRPTWPLVSMYFLDVGTFASPSGHIVTRTPVFGNRHLCRCNAAIADVNQWPWPWPLRPKSISFGLALACTPEVLDPDFAGVSVIGCLPLFILRLYRKGFCLRGKCPGERGLRQISGGERGGGDCSVFICCACWYRSLRHERLQ